MGELERSLDHALAEWVLGRITPKEAQDLAVRALEEGCASCSLAVIAGLNSNSRVEIDDELSQLLRELGKRRPSREESLKTLVDDCAARIADSRSDPVKGSRMMWDYWVNDDESSSFFRQIRPFIDLLVASDEGPITAAQSARIVAEAREFLQRGGLQI